MSKFFVAGVPVPKGSAKAFMNKGMKHPVVVQDNAEQQKPWASLIGYSAQWALVECVNAGAVQLDVTFHMPRPKSHYGTGKNSGAVKTTAPMHHTSKPDLDKLIRCVKDALTGIAWKDDSQVSVVNARKIYSSRTGATIEISEIELA